MQMQMNRWIAYPTLCAAAFALLVGTCQAVVTRDDVLTIRYGRFYLEGKPFAEVGLKKYDLFWVLFGLLKDGKGDTQEYRDLVAKQDRELRDLHDMGFRSTMFVGAPWAMLNFRPVYNDPEKRVSVFYKAMDTALDLCDKNHIKVIYELDAADFTDKAIVHGKWVYGDEQARELISNPNCRSRQELYRYIDDVVDRYKDRKTIMMWGISNEETNAADIMPEDHLYNGERMPNLADVARFLDDVAKRIKADDPLRLVNSGGSALRASQWNQYTNHNWSIDTVDEQYKALDLLYANSAVDVIDIHYYTNNKGVHAMVKDLSGQDVSMDIDRYMQAASRIGKPLMLGETGSAPVARTDKPADKKIYEETPDYHDSYIDPNATKWVKILCDEIVAAGPQITYWWVYSFDAPNAQMPRWNIEKGKTDPVLAVIVDANKRLKAKLGAE